MPLKVTRQPKESSQSLVGRFTQKLKKSGILLEARKRRFRQRPKSKQMLKKSALYRVKKRAEFEEKRKSGNL